MLEFKDNRIAGLLNEVRELVSDVDDRETAWRLETALRLISQEARTRRQELSKK